MSQHVQLTSGIRHASGFNYFCIYNEMWVYVDTDNYMYITEHSDNVVLSTLPHKLILTENLGMEG